MNFLLLNALLILSQGQSNVSAVDWLPGNTESIVVVNDFERARSTYLSRKGDASDIEFAQSFALRPSELSQLIVGPFLRAELVANDKTVSQVGISYMASGADVIRRELYRKMMDRGARITVKVFGSTKGAIIKRRDGDAEITSVHLVLRKHLLLTDSIAAAESIAAQIAKPTSDRLAVRKGFSQVWKQCSTNLGGEPLALAWYTDPWLRYRLTEKVDESPRQEYVFAKRHGIDGIVGVGGSTVFSDGEQRVQSIVYAPQPYKSSLQMSGHLTGAKGLALPDWVTQAASDAVVIHGKLDKSFEHAGLLFDDAFAEGVEGTYDDVLADLKELLELDVKKELYPHLGPSLIALYGEKGQRTWQPFVIAIENSQPEKVAEILKVLIADDPEAMEVSIGKKSDVVWRVPGYGGSRDFVIGMLNGYAVYSNDLGFAKQAMGFAGESKPLVNDRLAKERELLSSRASTPPSIMTVRSRNRTKKSDEAHTLDLVFHSVGFFAESQASESNSLPWLPRRLKMQLERFELVLGYATKDGWTFNSRIPTP